MKALFVIVFAALLGACATLPIPLSKADLIPLSDDAPPALSQPGPDKAKIIVIRDPQFVMPCREHIFLDGAHIAGLHSSDMVEFYVQPGKYTLSAEIGLGTMCKTMRTQRDLSFSGPGTYIYHIEMTSDAGMIIMADKEAFGMDRERTH